MSCELCEKRGGSSGYVQMTADGWVDLPCRCVTDERDHQLYGHRRNRLALLRALAEESA
jgi:hypothetical protein